MHLTNSEILVTLTHVMCKYIFYIHGMWIKKHTETLLCDTT